VDPVAGGTNVGRRAKPSERELVDLAEEEALEEVVTMAI
jgi:hypothetical protein